MYLNFDCVGAANTQGFKMWIFTCSSIASGSRSSVFPRRHLSILGPEEGAGSPQLSSSLSSLLDI